MANGDFLGNETFTEDVLEFLGNTGVGAIKEGVVLDKRWAFLFRSAPLFFLLFYFFFLFFSLFSLFVFFSFSLFSFSFFLFLSFLSFLPSSLCPLCLSLVCPFRCPMYWLVSREHLQDFRVGVCY